MATQDMLDKLDAAIASGQKVIQYNGKRIEYQDTASLIRARAVIANELMGSQQADVINRMSVASYTRD
jgi:hypothetical protein